jgi:hypothetical protein
MGNYAFRDCFSLTNVMFGINITNIGGGAFASCSNLSSINIPDSVASIGPQAFFRCSNLKDVTLSEKLTKIDTLLFEDCALATVVIPESVTSIGQQSFENCNKLTHIYFKGDAPIIGPGSFEGEKNALTFNGATNATIYYRPEKHGWNTTLGGRPTVVWK